jgi:hypothetical protein
LREFRRVAKNVPLSERYPKLTFSHYSKVLASIDNPARKKWAALAIREKWTADVLAEKFHSRQVDGNVEALKQSAKKSGMKRIKVSKSEQRRVDAMRPVETESGMSWQQLKRAIAVPDVQFEVVLAGVRRAVSNPNSFLKKHTKREARLLLMQLQDLESIVQQFIQGETDELDILGG